MTDAVTLEKPRRMIFAHSTLRELRLMPAEALVLINVASRDGDGGCFAKIDTLAADTGLDDRTVRKHLHSLERRGVLSAEQRPRKPTIYRVNSPDKVTVQPSQPMGGIQRDTNPPNKREPQPSQPMGEESNPIESNHRKRKMNGAAVAALRHSTPPTTKPNSPPPLKRWQIKKDIAALDERRDEIRKEAGMWKDVDGWKGSAKLTPGAKATLDKLKSDRQKLKAAFDSAEECPAWLANA